MIFENGFQLIQGEEFCIYSECLEIVHIINIAPHSIQGDVVLLEFGDDSLKGSNILVSPTALMVPQRPKGRNVRITDKSMEAFEQFLRILLTNNKPEIDYPPNHPKYLHVAGVAEALNLHVQCVAGPEVSNMILAGPFS